MTQRESLVGTEHEVEVGPLVHGGHCLAHVDGNTVFVRHVIPGERARIRITEHKKRIARADSVEILSAAASRAAAPCQYAGRCGGCDFQHIDVAAQRRLLGEVIVDAYRRIGGMDIDVDVQAVDPDALGWRTRMSFAIDDEGTAGLRKHRSHDIIPIDDCLIAHPELPKPWTQDWLGDSVSAVRTSTGDSVIVVDGAAGETITETVRHRSFALDATGFWQVHPRAAETLLDAVLRLGKPQAGERVADLYCGAGMFTAFLAEAVGHAGSVHGIEGDRTAISAAAENLSDLPQVTLSCGPVEREARRLGPRDLIVLDPPRAGAKRALDAIIAAGARRIVYVACDPATQARDIATLREHGYELDTLEAYALFPMTHHVETVALLTLETPQSGTS